MSRREAFALVLIAAGVVACVTLLGEAYRRAQPEFSVPVIPADADSDPNRIIRLRWMGPPSFASAQEGGWIESRLEKRFNVQLDPLFLDSTQYDKKKPLIFAGGNVPDVCWINDPDTLQRDVYHGFLAEVPYELLRRHAPTAVAMVNEFAPHAWLYARWKGRNFGLPTLYINGMYPRPGVWRMDWLENVGISEVPHTLEEMEEALRRFRYDDPDRNGLQDTYGMSGDVSEWWWSTFSDIFGAFGVAPFDFQYDSEGNVVWGGITPEAKQALALLRQWYEQELIDPEFYSDSMKDEQLVKKFKNGRIGYINYLAEFKHFDRSQPNSLVRTFEKIDPNARLAPGWFPAGPDGHRGGRVWSSGGNILCFGRQVADHPERAVRALQMLETLLREHSEQLLTARAGDPHRPADAPIRGFEAKAGRRGTHWDWKDPNVGPSSGREWIPPYDLRHATIPDALDMNQGFFHLFSPGPEALDRVKEAAAVAFRKKYQKPQWAIMDAFGKPDVLPSSGLYLEDLRNLQLTVYTRIIRGDVDLDAFNAFVEEWKARGGSQLLAEAREMVRAQREIYRQLDIRKPLDPAKLRGSDGR